MNDTAYISTGRLYVGRYTQDRTYKSEGSSRLKMKYWYVKEDEQPVGDVVKERMKSLLIENLN